MAKIDVFGLQRPERKVQQLTITDPSHPDKPLEFSLRAQDALDNHKAEAIAEELLSKYVHQELPFMVPMSKEDMTASLFLAVGTVYSMQPSDLPETDKWAPEELMAIARNMPSAWAQLAFAVRAVNADSPSGKHLRAGTATTGQSSDSSSDIHGDIPSET